MGIIIAVCCFVLLGSLSLVMVINSINDEENEGTLTNLIATLLEWLATVMAAQRRVRIYALPTEYPIIPTAASLMPRCECAVFDTVTPLEADRPIISRNPAIYCHSAVEQAWCCHNWCSHLASRSKSQGPQMLCSIMGHYTNLTASVHNRVLGTREWVYTRVTLASTVCCYKHKVVDC